MTPTTPDDGFLETPSAQEKHDRGLLCDDPDCSRCYEQVQTRPELIEPSTEAYVAELEDHLARRETAARLLDRILVNAALLDNDPTIGGSRFRLPDVVNNVTEAERRYFMARRNAHFEPDSA